MENKQLIQKAAEELFRAKQKRRRELAKLPFERKIGILIDLQKMADGLRAAKGGNQLRPWDISE